MYLSSLNSFPLICILGMALDLSAKYELAMKVIGVSLAEYSKTKMALSIVQSLRICDNCGKLDISWLVDELSKIRKQIINKEIYSRIQKITTSKCRACETKDFEDIAINTYLKCFIEKDNFGAKVVPNALGDTSIACASFKCGNITIILRGMKLLIFNKPTLWHVDVMSPSYIY